MRALLPLMLCIGALACAPQVELDTDDPIWEAVQTLSPLGELPDDPTNRVYTSDEAATLGEVLFNDPRLSANGEVACTSCHNPDFGFSDDRTLSETIGTSQRHAPTLLNAGWNRWFFWDGRADSLWSQALKPLEHPSEHGFSRLEAAHLIASDEDLRSMYTDVFGPLPDISDPDRFPAAGRPIPDEPDEPEAQAWESMSAADQQTITGVFVNLGKAIAAHERGLTRINAPFDDYVAAKLANDPEADTLLSPEAQRGLEIFVGDGGCILCHSGPTFSDLQFHNIGLSTAPWMDPTDLGRYAGITTLLDDPFNGMGAWSDDPEAGAEKLRYLNTDLDRLGQFKTPSLRNVALTAPYMHSGQLATLEEVVAFYSDANLEPDVGHREEILIPLGLSESDKAALVSFMETLTGEAP
jgi:cytochrome c peroxidase